MVKKIGVWLPCVKTGTGADMYTIRLASLLNESGVRAEIFWLPSRSEYFPWTVAVPKVPDWVSVIHINSWLHPRFVGKGYPVIVTLHSCVHDSKLRPYKNIAQVIYHNFWVRPIETENIARASFTTAVSKYTAEQASKVFSNAKIVVINNWVDTEKFRPKGCRREIHEPIRLLFIGKASKRKGIDLLPKIMSGLGEGYHLTMVGAGTLPYGNQSNILALGSISDQAIILTLYQECDVLLFPSRMEGLSLAALEALSSGLPIVASNTSSFPELVLDGETGFLCDADNVDEFVDKIRKIHLTPDLIKRFGVASRRLAESTYSGKGVAEHYIKLYEKI